MADSGQLTLDRKIFRPDAMARAMRDSRYRHPANAIAELIDNSIDAGATIVELLIQQQQERVTVRESWRVSEIAVADNGVGMNIPTLMEALRFGGRVPPQSRIGKIGKYGVGLPTASATQCRQVDVWSWQNGLGETQHCSLDIGAVEEGKLEDLSIPSAHSVPEKWIHRLDSRIQSSDKGTIVVWSNLREITQRPETIFRDLEQEVGRIYRHFINEGRLTIVMKTFRDDRIDPISTPRIIHPNDPLFLMENSATSSPWDKEPMFREYVTPEDFVFSIDGKDELVRLRYSIVKSEALGDQAQNPGNLPHGKDARRNTGVSIVREGRELLMEDVFAHIPGWREEPQNRWWGCEVLFDEGCDDLLGVDHNKQMTAALSDVAKRIGRSNDPDDDLREEYQNDPVYQIAEHIRATTRNMANEVRQMFKNRRKTEKISNSDPSPADDALLIATKVVDDEIKGGHPLTETDRKRIEMPEADREAEISSGLAEANVPNPEQRAKAIVDRGLAYEFVDVSAYGPVMFVVEPGPGILYVKLNINHALYDFLSFLTENAEKQWAHQAAVAIRVMLLAWARMEDLTHDAGQRQEVQDVAIRWGRIAKQVLEQVVTESEADG